MNRPNHPPGEPSLYSLYGDPAYPLRAHLLGPHRAAHLSPEEELFNTQMNRVRIGVEWELGKILQHFAFVDFEKPETAATTCCCEVCRECTDD